MTASVARETSRNHVTSAQLSAQHARSIRSIHAAVHRQASCRTNHGPCLSLEAEHLHNVSRAKVVPVHAPCLDKWRGSVVSPRRGARRERERDTCRPIHKPAFNVGRWADAQRTSGLLSPHTAVKLGIRNCTPTRLMSMTQRSNKGRRLNTMYLAAEGVCPFMALFRITWWRMHLRESESHFFMRG